MRVFDSIIIGTGEVGSAIYKIQKEQNKKVGSVDIADKDFQKKLLEYKAETLHITFPYFNKKQFVNSFKAYIRNFEPSLVIIHSTVPVGTTDVLGKIFDDIFIVHSPVRGQHPNLYESLKYFVKYIGTDDDMAYEIAKDELKGMPVKRMKSAKTSELAKLLCTSYYGVCISWHREMKKMCDKFGVDFGEAVTDLNKTYNKGYKKFRPNVIRPVLTPPEGKCGGHCVIPNKKLLSAQYKSEFLNLIK